MGKINYVIGDATQPQGEGKKIICHVCNDIGAWGAGFVLAISRRWSFPEQFYRARQKYVLGDVDIISVNPVLSESSGDIYVANMIGQHRTGYDGNGNPPIRYDAVRTALEKVNVVAEKQNATLHMPRIGCGLAGGEWEKIEEIIKEVVTVDVTVYDLK